LNKLEYFIGNQAASIQNLESDTWYPVSDLLFPPNFLDWRKLILYI